MHQPSGAMQGQAADIAIQAEQIVYLKRMMAERIAFHTGQAVERIEADSDRDRWFTAEEAKEYGFIDQVIDRSTAQVGRRLSVALEAPAPPPGSRPSQPGQRPGRFFRTRSPTPRRWPSRVARRRPKTTRVVSARISVARSAGRDLAVPRAALYLVRTEIKVKYKNSFLGLMWSMLCRP